MEGGQLHAVEVLRPHFIQHLLKRVETAVGGVHVILIHLQGEKPSVLNADSVEDSVHEILQFASLIIIPISLTRSA